MTARPSCSSWYIMDDLWYQYGTTPVHLLVRRDSSTDGVLGELLKRIQNEDVVEMQRVSVLCLLQEQNSVLLGDKTQVIDTVATLTETLKKKLESPSHGHLFAQQLAVTITTVVVEQGCKLEDDINEIITDVVVVLSKLLGKTQKDTMRGSLDMPILACLDELECAYPGLLQECASSFSTCLATESSALCQGYLMLCTACLQTFPDDSSSTCHHPVSAGCISPILPQGSSSDPTLPSPEEDLLKSLSSILDYLPLATTTCRSQSAERMYNCLVQHKASAKMFMSTYRSGLLSLDILTVQLSLKLLLNCRADLGEDALQLAQQRVMILASCPSISEEERLLTFEWASSLCVQWSPVLQSPLHYLYPTVFDSVYLSAVKLKQVSMHLRTTTQGDLPVSRTIMNCLSRLQKLIYYGISGSIAATFYSVLYVFFQDHKDTAFSKEACRLLLAVTSMQPQLISSTLDFIWVLSNKVENSTVGTELLLSMLQHLAGLTMPSVLVYLLEYLKLIQVAAQFPSIPVDLLLSVLMRILQQSEICKEGDWSIGNELLSACNCLMKRGQSLTQNREFNTILFLISSCYNDPDISDRARFYHLAMHTLSPRKLAQLLHVEGESNSANLSQLVEAELTGSPHSGQVAITHIQEHFLKLSRSDHLSHPSNEEATLDQIDAGSFVRCPPKIKTKKSVTVHYHLTFTYNEGECACLKLPLELHAVILTFSAGMESTLIPDIFLPCLKFADGDVCVPLTVYPNHPLPTKVTITARFCGTDGKVYSTRLAPINIQFSDFFITPNIRLKDLDANQWSAVHEDKQELTSQLLLNHSWQKATQIIDKDMKDYVVFHGDDEVHFLILFPSDCHLLMQWHQRQTGVHVILSTDNWIVLEQATLWLYSLFST